MLSHPKGWGTTETKLTEKPDIFVLERMCRVSCPPDADSGTRPTERCLQPSLEQLQNPLVPAGAVGDAGLLLGKLMLVLEIPLV